MEKLSGRNLLFVSLGRLGAVGDEVWLRFTSEYAGKARFVQLGELTSSEISSVLQFADAGVASSPWNLIEKSGSVAAMIEHGLPVIVTRNDFLPAEHFQSVSCAQLHPIWQEDFRLEHLVKNVPASRLPEIGSQFLADLANSGASA